MESGIVRSNEVSALSWPATAPRWGRVVLRRFRAEDVDAVVELSHDPYVPQVTTLVARATGQQAAEWIARQNTRLAEGVGFSFAIADARSGDALGQIGLWLKDIREGRTSAGYAVLPRARGRGVASDALSALTTFAWTIAEVHRIEVHIEPWNTGSIRTAERAGYEREGLLRSFMEIGGSRRDLVLYAAIRDAGPSRRA
jgi:RimJ/RimL family protein N-acetyltransferase